MRAAEWTRSDCVRVLEVMIVQRVGSRIDGRTLATAIYVRRRTVSFDAMIIKMRRLVKIAIATAHFLQLVVCKCSTNMQNAHIADNFSLDKRLVERVPRLLEPLAVVCCLRTWHIEPLAAAVSGAALIVTRCLLRLVQVEREKLFERELVDRSRLARRRRWVRPVVFEAADCFLPDGR